MGNIIFKAPVSVGKYVKVESGATYIDNVENFHSTKAPEGEVNQGQEEQDAKNAPLQSEVPKLDLDSVIPFIREMKERIGDSQIKWLSVYCVLREHTLIDKEMTTFCKLIKEKFGKKLNNKELSTQLNSFGIDYTQWDTTDSRVRSRQQIAVDLNRKIEDLKKKIATARQEKLKSYIGQ